MKIRISITAFESLWHRMMQVHAFYDKMPEPKRFLWFWIPMALLVIALLVGVQFHIFWLIGLSVTIIGFVVYSRVKYLEQ